MSRQLEDLSPEKQEKLKKRFWAKVTKQKNGCWIWGAAKTGSNYGRIGDGEGGTMAAHRLSWEIHNGPIPEGMLALHHCDQPPCVNPQHLFLGDHGDNAQDKFNKGREQIGRSRTAPGTFILRLTSEHHALWKKRAREQGCSMQTLLTIVLAGALSNDPDELAALVGRAGVRPKGK